MRKRRKVSDETRRRMSDAQKGRIPWNKGLTKDTDTRIMEVSERVRAWHKENKNTDMYKERSRKMSEAMKKFDQTGDRNPMWGRARPDLAEYNRKYKSEQMMGEKNHMWGRKFTEEHRKKISQSTIKTFTPERRKEMSLRMIRTRGKGTNQNTKIELALQRGLKNEDIGFETQKNMFDITKADVFIPPNVCVFADGNHWHHYPRGSIRDLLITMKLEQKGQKVLRFWGSEIKNNLDYCVNQIKGVV